MIQGTEKPPRLMFGLFTLRRAGAERVAFDLAENLLSRWEVRIVALHDHQLLPEHLAPCGPVGGSRELLFEKTDLLVTHLFLPGLLARLRRIWDRATPWIHTVHYDDYQVMRWGRLRRWLDHSWIYPGADALVAAGDTIGETLRAFPSVRVIPNGLDLGRSESRGAGNEGPPVMGTVAMLRREKGLEHLIDAASVLRTSLPGIKIRIAGDGPMRPALEDRIRQQELDDVVELCGYLADTTAFYQSLDVYVQPSRSESFGISALEAFRFGIPLVVTTSGNLPNLVGEGEWGLIVDPSEAPGEGLAGAMATAWADRDKWSARAEEGRRHWQSRLSVEAMVASYEELFRELLRKTGSER